MGGGAREVAGTGESERMAMQRASVDREEEESGSDMTRVVGGEEMSRGQGACGAPVVPVERVLEERGTCFQVGMVALLAL